MYIIKKEIQASILKCKFLHSRIEKLRYQKSIQRCFWKKSHIDVFLETSKQNNTKWQNKTKLSNSLNSKTTQYMLVMFKTETFHLTVLCTYISINWARTTRLKFAKYFKFVLEFSLLFTISEIFVWYIHFRQELKIMASFPL